MKILRIFIISFITLIIILLIASIYVAFQAVSDEPLVVSTKKSSPQSLLALKGGIKQAIKELNSGKGQKTISIKHNEIDELLAILSKSIPPISAKYNHSDLLLLFAMSVKLPSNPLGKYLNVSVDFTDSKNLTSGTTQLGDMSFDNEFVFSVFFLAASFFLDSDIITMSKQLLANTSYASKGISLAIEEDIDARLLVDRVKQTLKKHSNLAWDDGQFNGVVPYYQKLLDFSKYTKGLDQISVKEYLKILFVEAKKQGPSRVAAEENVDAVIALGMFAGDYNLKKLLSHVTNIKLRSPADLPNVELADRRDLMLHFLYSATIQVLSSRGLSVSLGELKEINDMDSGGSGFSFADLAADRAGIQFITMALDKKGGATHLQTFLADENTEESFFPDIFGLQEQLSLAEFENEYQNTDSIEYKSIVQEIDRRIRLLPLYLSYRTH